MTGNTVLYSIGFIALITLGVLVYFLYDARSMKKDINKLKTDMKVTVKDKLIPEHESNNEYIDWLSEWVFWAQQYVRIPGFDWKDGAVEDYDEWRTRLTS
jgi:hypothetical protein|tara:strand:- start:856 stop:1155 length:300 start_codon:yes stop_codon:yes gene_type:complete